MKFDGSVQAVIFYIFLKGAGWAVRLSKRSGGVFEFDYCEPGAFRNALVPVQKLLREDEPEIPDDAAVYPSDL